MSNVDTLLHMGAWALARDDLASALACGRFAVACMPESAAAHALLGAAHARAGRAKDAITAYQQASTLAPAQVGVWVDLAEAALLGLEYEIAATSLERALALDPKGDSPDGARAQMLVVDTLRRHG